MESIQIVNEVGGLSVLQYLDYPFFWFIPPQSLVIEHNEAISVYHSMPEPFRFTATDFNSYVTVSIAEGAPQRKEGRMAASDAPGLGVRPRMEVLGEPVMQVG